MRSNLRADVVTCVALVLSLAACLDRPSPLSPGAANNPGTVTPRAVATVTTEPSSALLSVDSALSFSAVARDADGQPIQGVSALWSSSDTTIAKVTQAGRVTALAEGSATISASVGGKVGASRLLTLATVDTVVVTANATVLRVGGTLQLTAQARDSHGTALKRTYSWQSSDPTVAAVNSAGVVSGVKAGTATISASVVAANLSLAGQDTLLSLSRTGSNGKKTGWYKVTVSSLPVASVAVTPASVSIGIGQSAQLSAAAYDSTGTLLTGRTVTWSSANPALATVSASGSVTGVAFGTTTVTATVEGKSASAAVNIVPVGTPVPSVSPAALDITTGQSSKVTATLKDSSGNAISGVTFTWATTNSSVAKISPSGSTATITGGTPGSASVTASADGVTAASAVVVTQVPVAKVVVSPSSVSLTVGQSVTLTAATLDSLGNTLTGRSVSWTTSNSAVATVSGTGVVQAMGTGTATITATSEGQSGTASVAVSAVPVASVTVSPATASVNVGSTVQLSAVTKDSSGATLTGRLVTWSTSGPTIATVSASGVVTGVGAGSVTITATSGGKSGSAAVTVTAPAATVASVSVSPASASVNAGATVQLAAVARDASGATVSGVTFTWSSANTSVATVTSSGTVTGVAAGTATVSATASGVSGSSAVTVASTTSSTSTSSGSWDYRQVVAGIRPRGFGQGTYSLLAPAGGTTYYVATTGSDAAAGTSDAPFRTINHAAQVARAGDVVTIRAGTYQESVIVANSGSASQPIVFQAEQRGQVVLTGGQYSFRPADFTYGQPNPSSGQWYVTVRGLIFNSYAGNVDGSAQAAYAVGATKGWRIEDCLFDNAGTTGLLIGGSYVTVLKSTFQNNWLYALSAWTNNSSDTPTASNYTPLDGIQVIDVVLKANHNLASTTSGGNVAKFLATRGTLIDNMESYQNNGTGWWFDWQNSNFTVQNSYFHDNLGSDGTGMFLEASWAPGLVTHNVFANNASAGINVANSSGLTIRQNLYVNNQHCLQLVYADRGTTSTGAQEFPLQNIAMSGNLCSNWTYFSGIHAIGSLLQPPQTLNITADSDTFDPGSESRIVWWNNVGGATSIAQMQSMYGWEASGTIGTIAWP